MHGDKPRPVEKKLLALHSFAQRCKMSPEDRTQNPLPARACGFDSLLRRSPPSKILEIGRNPHFIGFFAIRIVSNSVNYCQPMTRFRLYWQQLVTMGNCDFSRDFGAREWGRTITALRPPDFESGASASSATRARRKDIMFRFTVRAGLTYSSARKIFRQRFQQSPTVEWIFEDQCSQQNGAASKLM
jgi:hypothetical protein